MQLCCSPVVRGRQSTRGSVNQLLFGRSGGRGTLEPGQTPRGPPGGPAADPSPGGAHRVQGEPEGPCAAVTWAPCMHLALQLQLQVMQAGNSCTAAQCTDCRTAVLSPRAELPQSQACPAAETVGCRNCRQLAKLQACQLGTCSQN